MKNAWRFRSLCARFLLVLLAGVTHVAIAAAADSPDPQAIVVTAVKGEVSVTSAGHARAVQKGTVIELPATIRTGAHSSLDLRQDRTTVSIAADTSVEIPATVSGPQLERIVQMGGNAFYNVGKRESKKLRVETPYLVAVIKGTQFNVAVQPEGATVSLFEGRLEVRAPDGSDVVDLNAGEIAVRQRNDRAIRVLRMDSGEAVRNPAGSSDGNIARNQPGTAGHTDNASGTSRDATPDAPRPLAPIDTRVDHHGGVETDNLDAHADVGVGPGSVKIATDASLDTQVMPASASIGADVALGVDGSAVDVGVDTSVSVGVSGVDVGMDTGVDASVDLGAGAVDVGVDTSLDVGAGGVDLGVDTGVDAGVDLGAGTVDVGVDTSLDVGAGGVDLGVDTGVDAGVDLGGGAVDLGVDSALDVGGDAVDLGVDTGVDAGVDLGAGSVDLGTDLGVGGVDLGVDLGIDSGGIDLGVDLGGSEPPTASPAPPADSGGLLGGILGRLGRRN